LSFRRLGGQHDGAHPRRVEPGSSRRGPRLAEERQVDWGFAAASLDGASVIEVHRIRLEHAEEVLFMQNQQMIETLTSYASQETFTESVGSRGMKWCPQELDSCPAHHAGKARTELAVVVTDQEPRRLPIRCGFSELLGDLAVGRVAGNADVDDFSALQLNDKEGKEGAKEEVSDRQEVAGPDLVRMIV
jgi:hypothetical protein